MATTTTTHNSTPGLAQKAALGILASLPTTNPTLKVFQKALPHFPNLQNLGNGLSSAMTATLPAGPGAQNPNTNQTNMCDVGGKPTPPFSFVAYSLHITELPYPPKVARPLLWSVARVLFKDLREGEQCYWELRGTVPSLATRGRSY